jgi:hypothetical protein
MAMADEIAEVSNGLGGEPNSWDVSGSREIGEEFRNWVKITFTHFL